MLGVGAGVYVGMYTYVGEYVGVGVHVCTLVHTVCCCGCIGVYGMMLWVCWCILYVAVGVLACMLLYVCWWVCWCILFVAVGVLVGTLVCIHT